jgi:hypothetical protein
VIILSLSKLNYKKDHSLRILALFLLVICSGCVTTVRTSKTPLIVATYQYRDIWVLDCLSKPEADTIIRIVGTHTTLPVRKISYSTREILAVRDKKNVTPSCARIDVFTSGGDSLAQGEGIAYELEKVKRVWVVKGSYKWSQ